MNALPRILTIAGSDSSGGAGIQQDLKTISSLGGWGLSAITSVTAQNSGAVTQRFDLPADLVVAQIRAVVADGDIDAAKTGMLGSAAIVSAVASVVGELSIPNLVVDPVLSASSGATLLDVDAIALLVAQLLPLAAVVTPNALEAEALTGVAVTDVASQREAAQALVSKGAAAAVVTGGHVAGDTAVDVIATPKRVEELSSPRIEGEAHGTGCMFSAALAAGLARGLGVIEATRAAKEVVTLGIEGSVRMGDGRGVVRI